MTTDLTMLKASLEASQAALQAASYALQSVQAAVSALLLQSQPQEAFTAAMQNTHTETDAPPVACSASIAAAAPPVVVADELPLEPEDLDPMLAPLTPEERKGINAQLGQLEAAQLKEFTAAFRKAFDVPAEVRMIKGEITQQRHGAWILNYLEATPDGSGQ